MENFNFRDYVSNNILLKENASPFKMDGWNEGWFDDMGLLRAFAEIAALDYEIKNARRGSYATDGTLEDLADQLGELGASLQSISDEIMDVKDRFSEEEELDEGKSSGLKAAIDAADNEYDENEYDSVDDYLETYTGGYKDEVEQHLKMKYEG
jgi:predicted  nucleic acid-binding Zn-ribbon protein